MRVSYVDSNGKNIESEFNGLPSSGTLWCVLDGADAVTATYTGTSDGSGVFKRFTGFQFDTWNGTYTTLSVYTTDPSADAPLADGDFLKYNSSTSEFNPVNWELLNFVACSVRSIRTTRLQEPVALLGQLYYNTTSSAYVPRHDLGI